MKIDIPCRHTNELRELFLSIGEPVRFVGGCVRDTLKGKPVKDFDLATPALPETTLAAAEAVGYHVIPTGLQHGTVTVMIDGEGYEITTLRADLETDGRHAKVGFVRDYRTDAARRDFTINAMSVDMEGVLHDYFGGLDDLSAQRVIFVGDMDRRIEEDYLRILRFYRFRAGYGGNEPPDYEEGIAKHVHGMRRISGERIWSELSRIITTAFYAWPTALAMNRNGLLSACGLELDETDRQTQSALHLTRFAVGRPAAMLGMMVRDASALDAIVERWKISTIERNLASRILGIRRNFEIDGERPDVNVYDTDYWIDLAVDGMPIDTVKAGLYLLGLELIADRFPENIPVFPIRGQDLIDLGMKPGREVGDRLRELRDEWKASRYSMSADELLAPRDAVANNRQGPRP